MEETEWDFIRAAASFHKFKALDQLPQEDFISQQQLQVVALFCEQSGMNMNFSLQCLKANGWDVNRAAIIFTTLNNDNKIPPIPLH